MAVTYWTTSPRQNRWSLFSHMVWKRPSVLSSVRHKKTKNTLQRKNKTCYNFTWALVGHFEVSWFVSPYFLGDQRNSSEKTHLKIGHRQDNQGWHQQVHVCGQEQIRAKQENSFSYCAGMKYMQIGLDQICTLYKPMWRHNTGLLNYAANVELFTKDTWTRKCQEHKFSHVSIKALKM